MNTLRRSLATGLTAGLLLSGCSSAPEHGNAIPAPSPNVASESPSTAGTPACDPIYTPVTTYRYFLQSDGEDLGKPLEPALMEAAIRNTTIDYLGIQSRGETPHLIVRGEYLTSEHTLAAGNGAVVAELTLRAAGVIPDITSLVLNPEATAPNVQIDINSRIYTCPPPPSLSPEASFDTRKL